MKSESAKDRKMPDGEKSHNNKMMKKMKEKETEIIIKNL